MTTKKITLNELKSLVKQIIKEENDPKNKIATMFFDMKDLGKLGEFLMKLGNGKYPDNRNIQIEYSAINGITIKYPSKPPYHTKTEETGWSDEDGGYPTGDDFTYDSLGGLIGGTGGFRRVG